jgi:hypothetical protein
MDITGATSGTVGSPVAITVEALPNCNLIIPARWEIFWGDSGVDQSGPVPWNDPLTVRHTFVEPGQFPVSVTLMNEAGDSAFRDDWVITIT